MSSTFIEYPPLASISLIHTLCFLVSNDGVIKVACLDMSVATGKLDTLAVVIRTLKYDRWFENEY